MMDIAIDSEDMMECDATDIAGGSGESGRISVEIDLSKDEFFHHTDHKIDGKMIFPRMGYLVIAWKAFAKIRNEDHEKLSVVMEAVRFNESTEVANPSMIFVVNIAEDTGDFRICAEGCYTATGKIRILNNVELDELYLPVLEPSNDPEYLGLTGNDVYKVLNRRGYDYNGIFRAIRNSDNRSSIGQLDWHGNWISFIDAIFQFKILSVNTSDLLLPTGIEYAAIKPAAHEKFVANIATTDDGIPVYSYHDINIIKSGGIELRGIETSSVPRRVQNPQTPPIHERYSFVSYENSPIRWNYSADENSRPVHSVSLTAFVQIVIENIGSSMINAVEIAGERSADSLLAPLIVDIVQSEPNIRMDMKIVSMAPDNYQALVEKFGFKSIAANVNKNPAGKNLHLIIAANILTKNESIILDNLEASLRPGGFMILEETPINNNIARFWDTMLRGSKFLVIGKRYTRGKIYILLKYKERTVEMTKIWITSKNFSWLDDLQTALATAEANDRKILLVSEDKISGLIGLVNCLRREFPNVNVSYVYIENMYSRKFSPTVYRKQLSNQLTANVLKNCEWGSYHHLDIIRHQPIRIKPFHFATDMTIEQLISYAWTKIYVAEKLRPMDFDTNERDERCLNEIQKRLFLRNLVSPSVRLRRIKLTVPTIIFPVNDPTPILSMSSVENDFKNWELVYCSLNLRYLLANQELPKYVFPFVDDDLMTERYAMIRDGFSAKDHTGQRLMGILTTKLRVVDDWKLDVKKYIRAVKLGYAWGVPDNWSLEEAATVPFAYAMGYRCLVLQGKLKPGNSVLIHDGTEPIAQACIAIALHASCNVFTTVNSIMKIEFLKKKFPKLKHQNILRRGWGEETYQDRVLAGTAGKGVNVVVNSLTRDENTIDFVARVPPSTPRYVARRGRFVEITNFKIPESFCSKRSEIPLPAEMEKIMRLVNEGIESGAVQPLTSCVFNESNIGYAYGFMDSESLIGTALLKLRDDDDCGSKVEIVNEVSRIRMSSSKSYILVGDLEDFDLEIAEWIIAKGAKSVVLVTRSMRTGYQSLRIRCWREAGIAVTVSTVDISLELQVQQMLKDMNKIAPVGGIFIFDSVQRGGSIANQQKKDFKVVSSPKINGTHYLDIESRKFCRDLDYFVVFSSTVSSRGRRDESNIGFANSTIERIVERRKERGYPATAIQWEPELCQTSALRNGTIAQSTSSCLETLEFFLQQPHPVMSSVVPA